MRNHDWVDSAVCAYFLKVTVGHTGYVSQESKTFITLVK